MKTENDSRLRGYNVRVSDSTGILERTFCAVCGKPMGFVSKESSQLIAAQEVICLCAEHEEAAATLQLQPAPIKEY